MCESIRYASWGVSDLDFENMSLSAYLKSMKDIPDDYEEDEHFIKLRVEEYLDLINELKMYKEVYKGQRDRIEKYYEI